MVFLHTPSHVFDNCYSSTSEIVSSSVTLKFNSHRDPPTSFRCISASGAYLKSELYTTNPRDFSELNDAMKHEVIYILSAMLCSLLLLTNSCMECVIACEGETSESNKMFSLSSFLFSLVLYNVPFSKCFTSQISIISIPFNSWFLKR